jgi:hypothetical protein
MPVQKEPRVRYHCPLPEMRRLREVVKTQWCAIENSKPYLGSIALKLLEEELAMTRPRSVHEPGRPVGDVA